MASSISCTFFRLSSPSAYAPTDEENNSQLSRARKPEFTFVPRKGRNAAPKKAPLIGRKVKMGLTSSC